MRISPPRVLGVALCAGALVLTGCSGNGSTDKAASDTTCKEYNDADADTQKSMVTQMLKDQKGTEPANGEVTLVNLSVKGFCATAGKDSSKISEADPR